MYQSILKRNRVVLVENADFSHFKAHLNQEDLLTWTEIEEIEAEKTRYQQIGRFLDAMGRKPDSSAERFLNIVKKIDEILHSQFDLSVPDEDLRFLGLDPQHENTRNNCGTNGSSPDAIRVLQCELQDWYINTLSRLHPIPWCEWLELDLDHVFTNLEMMPSKKHQLRPRLNSDYENTQALSSMFNSDSSIKRSVCFVEGPAGIGKSTLCRHLVYLWSSNNFSIYDHSFDLALLLEAQSMSGGLKTCINQQLFPEDFEFSEQDIYECLQKHQKTCLIIIDGVDELTPDGKTTVMKLLKGERLRHVNLVLTGRPEASREFVKYAHSHFKLKGFSVENVEGYICKYFASNDTHLKNKLLNRLKSDFQLQKIVTNPFTTLLVCLLVQDNEGDIPANSIEIQNQVLKASCRNFISRKKGSLASGLTEENLFLAAGRLAYNGLKHGISVFPEETLASFCPTGFREHLLNSGILNKDFTLSRLNTKGFCYFPHKSFQELLCANYLSELAVEQLKKELGPLTMSYGLDINMFRLLLGMLHCHVKTEVVLESLCQKVEKMSNTRLVGISEALRWVLLLFLDINPNEDLLEFLTQTISSCNQLARAICYGSLYGYWAGQLLPCIQMSVQKMKLPPVAVVLDPRLILQTSDEESGDSLIFLKKDQHFRIATEVHVPRHHELLSVSDGPLSLCTSVLLDTCWSFVHCSSIKAAYDVILKRVKLNVLTILLIPGNDSNEDIVTLVKHLESRKGGVVVLFLVFEALHNDQHVLRMLSLLSSIDNVSFLKVKPVHVGSKSGAVMKNGCNPLLNHKYVFPCSINQMYYSRSCPY